MPVETTEREYRVTYADGSSDTVQASSSMGLVLQQAVNAQAELKDLHDVQPKRIVSVAEIGGAK